MKKISIVKLLSGVGLVVSLSFTSLVGCDSSSYVDKLSTKYDNENVTYTEPTTGKSITMEEGDFKEYIVNQLTYSLINAFECGFNSEPEDFEYGKNYLGTIKDMLNDSNIHDKDFKKMALGIIDEIEDSYDKKEKAYNKDSVNLMDKADKDLRESVQTFMSEISDVLDAIEEDSYNEYEDEYYNDEYDY